MKRITYSILFSLFFFLIGVSLLQAQVVKSWDFESSQDTWVAGGSTTASLSTNQAHGGSQSILLVQTSASVTELNLQNDGYKPQQGDSLNFWIWIPNTDTADVNGIQVFWQDGSGWAWHSKWINGTSIVGETWTNVGVTLPALASPLQRIGLQMTGKGTSNTKLDSMYVDDITVSKPLDTTLVTQWGRTSDGFGNGWPILNDSSTAPGDASIGGPRPMAAGSNGASLLGGFDSLKATMDKAVVVSGQLEFGGGDPGSVYTALRFALTFFDSATLKYQYTDTAKWVSTKKHSGYEITPKSGTTDYPNGGGGAGPVWTIKNGNWASTYSNNGGPFGGLIPQAPRNAVMTAGTYNWAVSVQQVNDTTNEVRYYIVKTDNSYWFGGTVQAPAVTNKFNSIAFWTKEGADTLLGLTGVKAVLGAPITVPVAPWQAYYIDQWGVTTDGFGNAWKCRNDSDTVVGDGYISGPQPMPAGTNGASIRGGFGQDLTIPSDKALVLTGQLEFKGSPGSNYTALRYAITYLDSLNLKNQYTDSAKWVSTRTNGSQNHHYGYEITPRSGTTDYPNGGGGAGPVWTIKNGNWASTYSNGGGPFGDLIQQAPRNAIIDEGTYNWAISVQQINDSTNEVRWSLVKTGAPVTYWFAGIVDAPAVTNKLNGIAFWTKGGEDTVLNILGAKIDMGNPITIPPKPFAAYYVDSWGFNGGTGGWALRSGEFTGDEIVGGSSALTGWAAVRGQFGPESGVSKDTALLVTGQLEFDGGGFEAANSLAFGLFYSDSAGTAKIDSASDSSYVWSGTANGSSGYLFLPQSGSNGAVTWSGINKTGTWGAVVNGKWYSTSDANDYVLGSGLPSPANATATAGTYDFAISVFSIGTSSNDVRFYLKKQDGSYNFRGRIVDNHSPLVTQKFNSINFALNTNTGTDTMKILNVKVDRGKALDTTLTGIAGNGNLLPIQYSLSQNYPNPFNPTTTINFALPKAGNVSLIVYDILGRKVAELVNGNLAAGYHTINFNASNFASGVYFYRLDAGNFVSVKKLMLLK